MRINNLKIAALMAATVLAGCRTAGDIDEIVAPHGFEFSATTEQDSKTALDGTKILWMAGDEISIFQGSAKGSKFVLAKGENTPNGTFSIAAGETFDFFGSTDPDATDPDYIALYPYDAAATIDGETVIATLPATQTYAENSFGNGAYPMIARSASRALAFKNVCGGIELPLKDDNGKIVVKSVKISGNNGEKIAGEARIETGDVPTVIVAETGSESVTLDCGEGVALDAAAKSFILALPPTEFANGITIEVATANGVFTKTTANAVSIVRSGIRKMAELQVEEQTEEAGPVICNDESYKTIADAVKANAGATEITLKAGTFTLPDDLKNLKFIGNEGSVIDIQNVDVYRYSDVVFNNITFNAGQENYHGFKHAETITFNKCTIKGLLFGYGSHEIYNECVFNNPTGEYCMWTYGANADYTGCVFNGNGKFLHVYNEGSVDLRTINIKDCKFVSTAKNKAAVNVKSSCGNTHLQFNVNIDNCTTKGEFPEANEGLWACDNKFFDTVSIKVDGTEVYLDYKEVDGGYEIYSAKGLQWLAEQVNGGNNFSGKTITLAADIDLENANWTPIGSNPDSATLRFNGIFDGTGRTISNLNVNTTVDGVPAGLFGAVSGTVKNFTIENATINSVNVQTNRSTGVAVGIGYPSAKIENVTVKYATVNAFRQVGGIVGYLYGTVSGCTVDGLTIEAPLDSTGDNGDKVGGIAGFMGGDSGICFNNTVTNANIKAYRDVGGILGIIYKGSIDTFKYNTVTDSSVEGTKGENANAGAIVGRYDGTSAAEIDSSNTATNVTVIETLAEGIVKTETGYEIQSATGLSNLAALVNGGKDFAGETITLTADIDLDGIDWRPIGNVTSYPGITFAGTFDGGEHTISNLTTSYNTTAHASAGLFGSITGKVRNLKLENVNVSSSHYAGAIVGYSSAGVGMEISNCHVNGGTIVSSPEAVNGGHDNGDKVGGIIGYTVAGDVVKGCSVSNITVSGYRDIGGIAGGSAANVSNCTATAVTIVQDNTNAYKNERITTYKSIIGRDLGGTKTGNTASNMTYCIKNLTTTDALSFTNASVAESGSTFILDGVSVQSVTINGAAKIDTFTVKNSAITAAETNPGGPARFGFFIAPNTTDVLTVNVENTKFNSSWSHAIYAQILGNENFNIKVSGCNFSNWGMKETAETDKATSACLKILNAPGITETETERTNYKNTFLSANTWTKPEATYTVINLTDKDNVEHCFSE